MKFPQKKKTPSKRQYNCLLNLQNQCFDLVMNTGLRKHLERSHLFLSKHVAVIIIGFIIIGFIISHVVKVIGTGVHYFYFYIIILVNSTRFLVLLLNNEVNFRTKKLKLFLNYLPTIKSIIKQVFFDLLNELNIFLYCNF